MEDKNEEKIFSIYMYLSIFYYLYCVKDKEEITEGTLVQQEQEDERDIIY